MVPDVAGTGHSFKGAMAYYLHDKRQEQDGPHPETSERVAWTECRNMNAAGPHTATRIMIETAKRADELKAEAGVKNTGRKSNAHVYAYSLAWHPDEAAKLSRAEMNRAVDESLKALGAADHQAVIVCHTDQKHPHVHVILNRVHPETGRMFSTGNDRVKLSEWANAYERERGQILTPKREEKRTIAQQHEKAERKAFIDQKRQKAAAARKARQEVAKAPEARQPDRKAEPQPKPTPARPQSEASILKELHDAQKARHKQEWADLAARSKAQRSKIYDRARDHIRTAAAEAKEQNRPLWSDFFRQQREEKRRFDERERTLAGVVRNCIAAAKLQERHGEPSARGFLTTAFAYLASRNARQVVFTQHQAEARARMSAELQQQADATVQRMKDTRAATLAKAREQYQKARADLIQRQNAEQAKMRDAWRQVYERRGKDPRYSARQNAAPQQEQKPMKRDFDTAREKMPVAKQPTQEQRISTPAPAPSPAGEVPRRQQTSAEVPKVDRPAEWAKTAQGRDAMAKDAPAPKPARAFERSAEPKPAAPAPEQTKPQTRADYWNDRAKHTAADRPQEVARDRGKDRDFDRDR